MIRIIILSTTLSILLFSFAMYKLTHNPNPQRVFCGYNLSYPEHAERNLKFFANIDLKTFVDIEGKKLIPKELAQKGQKRCLLAFTLTLPAIFWVFTCSLMTLTPWGWRLGFWKRKFDSIVFRNIVLPLIILMPIPFLVFFLIFLYKLLTNSY